MEIDESSLNAPLLVDQQPEQDLDFQIQRPTTNRVYIDPPAQSNRLSGTIGDGNTVAVSKPVKVESHLTFSKCDKAKIFLYNLIEPVLISCLLGTTLQISQLGTIIYLVTLMGALFPMLLTEHLNRLQCKKWLTFALIIISPSITLMKMWIYCQFTDTKNVTSNPNLEYLLGVWQDQWTKTFLVDIVVFVLSCLLLWTYYSYIEDTKMRLSQTEGTFKKQIAFILLHNEFKDKAYWLFLTGFFLFFVDTLVYQSVINLVILVMLIWFVHQWALGKDISKDKVILQKILRIMQLLSSCFIVLAFVLRVPYVLDSFEAKNQRLLQVFGLEALVIDSDRDYVWLSRSHRYILSFAIVTAEAFFVASAIFEEKPVVEDMTSLLQALSPLASGRRQPQVAQSQQLQTINNLSLELSQNKRSGSMKTEKKKKDQSDFESIFTLIRLPLWLWVCRLLCFIQVYRFHDWQSLVPLAWCLHSFMWENAPLEPQTQLSQQEQEALEKEDPNPHTRVSSVVDLRYIWLTNWVYLPLMYACYVWYSVVNIFGLIDYADQSSNYYEYGFYRFQNPELELPICLSSIIAIVIYTRFSLLAKAPKLSLMGHLRKYQPTLHSACYLVLINIQVVVFTYLVIFSLLVMDFFHILVLGVMIFAQFQPKFYNNNIMWLLVYANFYVMAKYIYSLIPGLDQQSVWGTVVGFSTDNYDPASTKEFWRLDPPIAAWFFVFAVALQYHRNLSVIMDDETIEKVKKLSKDRIDMKSPTTQSIKKVCLLLMNHWIVVLTFVAFLVTVFLTRRSFMNGITLILTLTLLGIYMNQGIAQLTKYWRVLQIYQALVLASVIFVQFLLSMSQLQNEQNQVKNVLVRKWETLTPYQKALWQYAGFYRFTDPIWLQFLPLVFLFFFSIIVEKYFITKMEMEKEKNVIEPKIVEEEQEESKQLDFQQDPEEPDFFNQIRAGEEPPKKVVEITEAEKLKRKQLYDAMQYKISYLLWKLKPLWPMFTFVSLGFQYVLFTFIMGCALYYSIAVIWFIWLVIFMLQTWYNQRAHMLYQKKQVMRNVQKDEDDEIDRMLESANAQRYLKLKTKVEQNATERSHYYIKKRDDLDRQLKQAEKSKDKGEPRMWLTDEEAVEEHRKYQEEIPAVTVESREFYWTAQYAILVIANILLYFSTFIVTQVSANNPETLVPPKYQARVLFIFFFSGFYTNANVEDLSQVQSMGGYWPFFTLLLLLVIEKWCQQWIKNRFGADQPGIDKEFTDIENMYNELRPDLNKQKSPSDEVVQPTDLRRSTYNFNSADEKLKRSLVMEKLYPLLTIKYKLKIDLANKIMIQEVAIMLVFISLIYKQSIYSFILYVVLIYYTIQKFRNANPMLLVRYTVVTVILLEYVLALTNLSSYNSPREFPSVLTESKRFNVSTVYPNQDQLYYSIPWYFNVTQNTTATTDLPVINVSLFQFFGICVSGHQLNGLWIDFAVVMMCYFYLNNFSIWIIKKEFKIVRSDKTNELLREYQALMNPLGEVPVDFDSKEFAKQLQNERTMIRFFHFSCENLYTNFSLIMILFLMLTSVFSHNFIALGYFCFSMVLIYNYRNFFKESEARDNQILILKWFLLPYLLLDILAQLSTQIPYDVTNKGLQWIKSVGFTQVWQYNPAYLYLGEDVMIVDSVAGSTSLTILFLKAVVYFIILVQLDTVTSPQFLKFYDKILFENLEQIELIGKGLAYRFNNFKIKKLKNQGKDYQKLDTMLKEVKALVKRRNLWKKSGQEELTNALIKKAKTQTQPPEIQQIIEKSAFDESNEIQIETNKKLNYKKQFQLEWKPIYEDKRRKLNPLFRLYLNIRRNYVQDILFKHSFEHLQAMVQEFKEGRTNIRTQIELGLMFETKQEWVDNKKEEFEKMFENQEITAEQLEEFKIFRRGVIASFQLKPWQRYNPETFLSYKSLFQYYIIVLYKLISSNIQVLCYIFMILAVLMNGGAIYMIYPALVFGVAMVEEERPGKLYWYFVIFYTQLLILIQYVAQLEVFQKNDLYDASGVLVWCQNHNIGIIQISDIDKDYSKLFLLIFPELCVLISVLIHIQKETMAGIFDCKLSNYEQFRASLVRAEKNLLERDKNFKVQHQMQNISFRQLLEGKIDYEVKKRRCLSHQDKADVQETIQPDDLDETMLLDQTVLIDREDDDFLRHPLKVDMSKLRVRSYSFDVIQNKSSETNLIKKAADKVKKLTTGIFYDNDFFERLFPRCKQQKPGNDLYVWIALVSIVIIIYIILAFTQMSGQKMTSISQQFNNNQFSGDMVLSMIIVICIMVVDRYFYSSQSFFSRKEMAKKLKTDAPLQSGKSNSSPSEAQSQSQENASEDAQSNNQRATIAVSVTDTQVESDLDNGEGKMAFQDWLIPQYIQKTPQRVFRYYFLWFVLILGHWYIFFYLTDEPSVCASIKYCNTFYKNTYLIFFYIIFCLYLALCAAQIRYGLPELKKGGFLQDKFDPVSKITYQSWYYTPFLFELRTIIDWTFTTTSLDVFQAISVAQIQSDLYIAKCYNKPYMEKELGKKIPWFLKVGEGFSLMLFIIVLIAGPMLLFSSLNPVGQPNPVSQGDLSFYINLGDPQQGTNLTVNLFVTTSLTKNQTITQAQWEGMQFDQPISQSDQFQPTQTQALSFSPISDNVWGITQPKKQVLLSALKEIQQNQTTDTTAVAFLQGQFERNSATSVKAVYQSRFPLTFANQTVLTQLIDTINCNENKSSVVFPTTINTAIELNQKSYVQPLNQLTPVLSGFTLDFNCTIDNQSEDYWVLLQNWPPSPGNPLYDEETSIFLKETGFGYFVFNQEVLPSFLSAYASSVIFFYVAIVYVIASAFRSAFVPLTWEIFIINAVLTDTILKICQCIYIYRVQRNLENEGELYHILLEIMRSPETIKQMSGTSLKKKLE